MLLKPNKESQLPPLSAAATYDDDDDFQIPPLSQPPKTLASITRRKHLKPSSSSNNNYNSGDDLRRSSKKPKQSANPGKENVAPTPNPRPESDEEEGNCSLDLIQSSIDCTRSEKEIGDSIEGLELNKEKKKVKEKQMDEEGYFGNSIEARLMRSSSRLGDSRVHNAEEIEDGDGFKDIKEGSELDVLIRLCAKEEEEGAEQNKVQCPLCGVDISDLSEEGRQLHSNRCLDEIENDVAQDAAPASEDSGRGIQQVVEGPGQNLGQVVDVSPVVEWLRNLGLERYEEAFVREEIDWDALQWLTEEDLFGMGITALGPRKKIVNALAELRKGCHLAVETCRNAHTSSEVGARSSHATKMVLEGLENSRATNSETSKPTPSKLITDYFPGKKICTVPSEHEGKGKSHLDSVRKSVARNPPRKGKLKDIPSWCSIPGTAFRVDAFKYLRGDCGHWFLTHFHMDHYQGLTRSFCHGKIYCSLITAKLVNMKIGIPWDRLLVLPLNQKINIAGVDVTCFDANHCPGSIIILFEPPNGKAVLHTGDFRFGEMMANTSILQMCPVHTLILDTTYCNPQYDFPKQEAVIQFVIEAIQAEAFNPKTLFLIGSYTIGKERLFLEVARVLRRKVHVTAAKFRLLECMGLSEEDLRWLTLNEQESHIHVIPMWTIASFKRLRQISSHYAGRFSLIVAFTPTGWTFSKGKKKSPGRRWQQGTIIRYEVPYSEHCSFTELKEFVKLVSPQRIIPSVNNDGPDSADAMVSLLLS